MRRYFYLLSSLLALLLLATGCIEKTGRKDEKTPEDETEHATSYSGYRNTVLYYETDDGLMAPVMRQIPWEEGIGRAALEYLVDDEENRAAIAPYGLRAPIPGGTDISLRIGDDRHAEVELSHFSVERGASDAYNMVTSIVNTLTEFPAIETVSITADGKPIGELTGEASLSQAHSAFALNAEESSVQASTDQTEFPMTLYFPNSGGSLLIPVTRYCGARPSFSSAVQALIEGPQAKQLLSCFPAGTELISAEIENGAACIDLSGEYAAVDETEGLADIGYETLLLTAQAFGDVSMVEVLIEGEPYTMESVSTLAPFYANALQ